ncbi:hypothetical protein E2C01_025549 [Portunus trituberculatus]|uniref:Uncharacterized protein n=1 Tax=Portunus trituberculatus TaxID=210409 RepID=A0A5B7EDL2_PORTR|nr:hypothetical protein [Portunus trituberculatus]
MPTHQHRKHNTLVLGQCIILSGQQLHIPHWLSYCKMMSLQRLRDSRDVSPYSSSARGQTRIRRCHLHCRKQMWKGQL